MNASLILLGFVKSVVTNPALLVQLEWAKGMVKGMCVLKRAIPEVCLLRMELPALSLRPLDPRN
jgi:hypothetical protein